MRSSNCSIACISTIEQILLPELQAYLNQAYRADFCVGYFNLRGWREIDADISNFQGGEDRCCRLLVGMYKLPNEELRRALAIGTSAERIDQGQAVRLKTLIRNRRYSLSEFP